MNNIILCVNVVLPIFIVIAIGYILKQKKFIDDIFVSYSTKIVFKLAIPITLFKRIANYNFYEAVDQKFIYFLTYCFVGLFLTFILSIIIAKIVFKERDVIGAVIQGTFRSNFIIIGYPIIQNWFGDEGMATAALLTIVAVPLFNVLTIFILTIYDPDASKFSIKSVLINIIKNPLILGILVGLVFSLLNIKIPSFIQSSINIVSGLSTPLSLLGIGAFFTFTNFKKYLSPIFIATFFKIVMFPVIFTFIAHLLGFSGILLGTIFILFASPTSVSSFIMAKAMNSNSTVAANIIVFSTSISIFTLFTGIWILTSLQWV
ncbi:AEC family transporter [Clostridium sediminicola]|uniref:AEC family transporter n=1 Tax=Clostridium sediminicola TaxID=3114879 RepID=UPI0031F21302